MRDPNEKTTTDLDLIILQLAASAIEYPESLEFAERKSKQLGEYEKFCALYRFLKLGYAGLENE